MWLSHERLGYNYRMDELSAALGAARMLRIDGTVVSHGCGSRGRGTSGPRTFGKGA